MKPLEYPPEIKTDVERILAGSYDLPFVRVHGNPRILDIGANVGAFTAWALTKWPTAQITAYEPDPTNFGFFRWNHPDVEVYNVAVTSCPNPKLYRSKVNCCLHTILPHEGPDYAEGTPIHAMSPSALPSCDILKIDTEGSELDILQTYGHRPLVILLEAHSDDDRGNIEYLLNGRGYQWVCGLLWKPGYAEMKFVRKAI